MTTLATRAAEGLPRRAFTVSDVQRMLEAGILDWDEKFELIGGEIVPMPSQLLPHAIFKTRIARWLMAKAPSDLEVVIEPTVTIQDKGLFEPDVVVFESRPIARSFLPIAEIRLAIEVADTSLDRDLKKARDYADAGLPELWIVDLNARQTLVFRTENGVWTEKAPVPFDQPIEALCAEGATLLIAPLTE